MNKQYYHKNTRLFMEALLQDKNMKRICVLILVLIWAWSVVGNNSVPGDSVGVKVMEGKTLIVYRMSAGETAYAVSRKYGIAFKDLAAANPGVDMGALKTGQEILVPTTLGTTTTVAKSNTPTEEKREEKKIYPTQEKISVTPVEEKKETIIQQSNSGETQPVEKTDESAATTSTSDVLATSDLSKEPATPNTDKSKTFGQLYAEYMSGDMIAASEKGVATWIENNGIEASGDRFYALHNSAPVGSIVKIRNLMNNRTIYAKVIGNLSESEVSEKVLVKLSAGAAERLNVLDNRFVVEITYYMPEEQASK